MADSRKFEIQVSTSFNPAGTQQATDGLNQVAKATEKTGEHAKELNIHGREMRRLFGEIDRIAPGLGESLKGLFEPQAAGIIAAIVGIELLTKQFEKWKKQQEEAAALSAALWQAQFEGAQKAAESAREYQKVINEIPSSLETITQNYSAAKIILDEQVKAHKIILEDLEQEALAAAGGDKSKEDEIRRAFAARNRSGDIGAEQTALDRQRDELSMLTGSEADARRRADLAQAAKRSSLTEPAEVTAAKSEQENFRQRFAEANKYIEDNGGIEHARHTVDQIRAANNGNLTVFGEDLQKTIEMVDKFKATQKTISDWDTHVKEAAEKAADTVKEFEALRSKVRELQRQIDTAQGVLNIHKGSAARQNAFDTVDRAGGFANADNIISQGAAAVEAYQHGQKLSSDQYQQIAAMRALFEAVGGNSVAIINLLKQSLAHHLTLAQEVAQLQQQFTNLKSSATRNSPTGQ